MMMNNSNFSNKRVGSALNKETKKKIQKSPPVDVIGDRLKFKQNPTSSFWFYLQ